MGEFFGHIIFYAIFNTLGAIIRWIYGLIWRSIFNKPKFSFNEYLNGPSKDSDFYDDFAHNGNNIVIGLIFFFLMVYIMV